MNSYALIKNLHLLLVFITPKCAYNESLLEVAHLLFYK